MQISRRHLLGTTAAAAAVAAPFVRGARAQTEIKFGHVAEPGSLIAQCADEFARLANEKLGDKALVRVYGSSQLGGDSEMMKKIKLGTIDLTFPTTVMTSFVPEFGMFEMPYLVKDREHMKRIRDEVLLPTLAPLAEQQGYLIHGIWENGFRHITNNRRPIVVPEDLRGIKLRVPQGVWRVKMFETYGANPSPMAYSEVFVALQTGVMDGQENPLAQIYPARFHEVQKFLSMSSHVYTPGYVISGRSWDRFDSEVQDAIDSAAKESQDFVYQLAAELDEDLLQKLKEGGMEVNEVDRDAFIEASKPVYELFASEVSGGQELVDRAQSLADAS
jgi:TRAP-type transport system periplasmic protein